jgi:hypothetical protein
MLHIPYGGSRRQDALLLTRAKDLWINGQHLLGRKSLSPLLSLEHPVVPRLQLWVPRNKPADNEIPCHRDLFRTKLRPQDPVFQDTINALKPPARSSTTYTKAPTMAMY